MTPHVCPGCKCQFVQPFVCTTCGAQKLYDVTVRSQAETIQHLRRLIARVVEWRPMFPAEASLLDELAIAAEGVSAQETGTVLPHLDTCNLKAGGSKCTCGLL